MAESSLPGALEKQIGTSTGRPIRALDPSAPAHLVLAARQCRVVHVLLVGAAPRQRAVRAVAAKGDAPVQPPAAVLGRQLRAGLPNVRVGAPDEGEVSQRVSKGRGRGEVTGRVMLRDSGGMRQLAA